MKLSKDHRKTSLKEKSLSINFGGHGYVKLVFYGAVASILLVNAFLGMYFVAKYTSDYNLSSFNSPQSSLQSFTTATARVVLDSAPNRTDKDADKDTDDEDNATDHDADSKRNENGSSNAVVFKNTSPWASHPKSTQEYAQNRCESWKTTTRYAPRFFLGGGKAGSTALWMMLWKGTPWSGAGPTASDFIGFAQEFPNRQHGRDTGKEMCFGGKSRDTLELWNSHFENSSNITSVGLDCCPRGVTRNRICHLWKLFECEIKFVMPVRDPADRAVSWFNDKGSGGGGDPKRVDKEAPRFANRREFRYFQILKDALDCGVDPRAILVVDTDGLKGSPDEVQLLMDTIDEHYGIPRMKHPPLIANNAKADSGRYGTAKAMPASMAAIRRQVEGETRTFLELLETPRRILKKTLNF